MIEYKTVITAVCQRHGITQLQLMGPARDRKRVKARMEVAQELSARNLSPAIIGQLMNRDRTTVLHWLGKTVKSKKVGWRNELSE